MAMGDSDHQPAFLHKRPKYSKAFITLVMWNGKICNRFIHSYRFYPRVDVFIIKGQSGIISVLTEKINKHTDIHTYILLYKKI